MKSKLSIIIPIFNEKLSLSTSLESWIEYVKNNNFHLILVDDGSTDDSASILNRYNNISIYL